MDHLNHSICLKKITISSTPYVDIDGPYGVLHMGTFPDRQHYFAAAGENRYIGSLWRGPFFIGRILFFADP